MKYIFALILATSISIAQSSIPGIIDANGNVWSINTTAPCVAPWATKGMLSEVVVNGALDATTCEVTELEYTNGLLWQMNSAGSWYYKNLPTDTWTGPYKVAAIPSASTASLSWTAPTTNTDGSKIVFPISYNVYRGTSAASLVMIASVTINSYVDTSVGPGVYYYAVTSVVNGIESQQTPTVSDTIAGTVTSAPKVPQNLTLQ